MESGAAMTRIDEIRERLDKARPGPWHLHSQEGGNIHDITGRVDDEHGVIIYAECESSDADLIANAPADLAWLLDAVARRDARCEDLAVKLNAIRDVYDQHVVDVVAGSPAEKILDILNDTKEN